MKKILTIVMASALLIQVSCNNEEDYLPEVKGAYSNGFLIANEGNFGTPNASISFIADEFQTADNEIYQSKNSETLGDVLQSVAFSGDNAYLVANNSNKVVVANRYTMEKQATITEQVSQPRYATFANNKMYLTNNAYGGAKYVSVYNSDNAYVTKLNFSSTVERILTVGGKVFVQHASFGYGNQYSFINPSDDTLQGTYTVPNGRIQKSVAYENTAYILANGNTDSYIYKVNTDGSIDATYTISGISNAKNLDVEAGKFYFTSDNGIYKMSINGSSPSSPFITVADSSWSTLYGFDVIGNLVFTADAKGFTEASEVSVYDATDGHLIRTFNTGRGTNSFYLN